VRASPLLRCTAGDPPSQSLLKIKALYRYELHGQRISFTLLNLSEIELGIYFVFEILKGYSTFFGNRLFLPVKQLGFTVFGCIQPIF